MVKKKIDSPNESTLEFIFCCIWIPLAGILSCVVCCGILFLVVVIFIKIGAFFVAEIGLPLFLLAVFILYVVVEAGSAGNDDSDSDAYKQTYKQKGIEHDKLEDINHNILWAKAEEKRIREREERYIYGPQFPADKK